VCCTSAADALATSFVGIGVAAFCAGVRLGSVVGAGVLVGLTVGSEVLPQATSKNTAASVSANVTKGL